MSSTIRLGTIDGIPVRLHISFILLAVIWVALDLFNQSFEAAISSSILVVLIFGSVFLHELGHAWAARAFKIKTLDIVLSFFGGMARLERSPRTPLAEGAIAFAGPAVNIALAAVCYSVEWLFFGDDLSAPTLSVTRLVHNLAIANLALAIFNLLPGYPLDGGLIARSLLSLKLARRKARLIVARSGQVFAVILGFFGLAVSPMSLPIAVFLFSSARDEINAARGPRRSRRQPAYAPPPQYRLGEDVPVESTAAPRTGLRARLGLPRKARM